jgi:hypothetical protein
MRQLLFLWLLVAFFASPLLAQEIPPEPSAAIFPLALVLEAAEFAADGAGTWRPDWPLEFPPDAFKVRAGEISKASIEGEHFFSFSIDPEGREFPFMLNGRMAQAGITYGGRSEIREIVLSFPAERVNSREAPDQDPPDENLWELEILEYRDSYPLVIRGLRGDAWYFINLSRRGNSILETWYDEEGMILGAYGYSLGKIGNDLRIRVFQDYSKEEAVTEYHYDSRLFVTESSGPGGVYTVLFYREDLPRYWERRPRFLEESIAGARDLTGNRPGNFTLQWDERGMLLRITGGPDSGDIDYRYEYTFDGMGNWIERREIRMTRQMGLLVPSQGTIWRRVLEYGKSE